MDDGDHPRLCECCNALPTTGESSIFCSRCAACECTCTDEPTAQDAAITSARAYAKSAVKEWKPAREARLGYGMDCYMAGYAKCLEDHKDMLSGVIRMRSDRHR